jgi:hypothetical protein
MTPLVDSDARSAQCLDEVSRRRWKASVPGGMGSNVALGQNPTLKTRPVCTPSIDLTNAWATTDVLTGTNPGKYGP